MDIITLTYPLTSPMGVECGTDEETKEAYDFQSVTSSEDGDGNVWRTIEGERESVKDFCENYCLIYGLDGDIDDTEIDEYYVALD